MKPVVIALILLALLIILCRNSKFTSTQTSTTSMNSKYDSIDDNTVLIFYAPWCGHCKKSMPEFLEASENQSAKVVLVNSDDPSAKSLINKYSVTGYPKIIKGDGTPYGGDRRSREIIDFANGK